MTEATTKDMMVIDDPQTSATAVSLDGPEWESDEEDNKATETAKEKSGKKGRNKKRNAAKGVETPKSNVVYVGHLPWGFEETQLITFFKQFGDIKQLFLSRSKKNANSRGYAFIKFEDEEVAEIVADTMNGYFLLEKRLVCHLLPPGKTHPKMFERSKRFRKIDWAGRNMNKMNAHLDGETLNKRTNNLVRKERKKKKAMKDMGIDYDFPGYEARLELKKGPGIESNKVADGTEMDVDEVTEIGDEKSSSDATKKNSEDHPSTSDSKGDDSDAAKAETSDNDKEKELVAADSNKLSTSQKRNNKGKEKETKDEASMNDITVETTEKEASMVVEEKAEEKAKEVNTAESSKSKKRRKGKKRKGSKDEVPVPAVETAVEKEVPMMVEEKKDEKEKEVDTDQSSKPSTSKKRKGEEGKEPKDEAAVNDVAVETAVEKEVPKVAEEKAEEKAKEVDTAVSSKSKKRRKGGKGKESKEKSSVNNIAVETAVEKEVPKAAEEKKDEKEKEVDTTESSEPSTSKKGKGSKNEALVNKLAVETAVEKEVSAVVEEKKEIPETPPSNKKSAKKKKKKSKKA